jgi:hypothetical protein
MIETMFFAFLGKILELSKLMVLLEFCSMQNKTHFLNFQCFELFIIFAKNTLWSNKL